VKQSSVVIDKGEP